MKYVTAYGGMMNRLRVILSHRALYSDLTVGWVPDGEVHHERFLDVFERLSGVTFVDNPDPDWPRTLDPLHTAWAHQLWHLRTREPIELPRAPYAAMHIRRTDARALQEQDGTYQDDPSFLNWALAQSQQTIYLATDNGTTQRLFVTALERSGKTVKYFDGIYEHITQDCGGVRNTSLRHAWADVLACAHASEFKGSGSSSFTDAILAMRSMR